MDFTTPHFLLFSRVDHAQGSGLWQFVFRTQDGTQRFEAEDAEPDLPSERLDLLTIVRALESLDQPSRVTLVECSDYVWKGVRYGLPEWRSNGWRWEFFGQMVPVKNSDLWQRLIGPCVSTTWSATAAFRHANPSARGCEYPHWNTKLSRGASRKAFDC